MGQTSVGRLHGRLDVLQTLLVAPPSWIQDGGAGNDINQDLGRVFPSLLRGRCKMATLPLPAAILDDLICGTGNEVIQDGRRKRKGRHFAPPPQWGSKNSPYTTYRPVWVLPHYLKFMTEPWVNNSMNFLDKIFSALLSAFRKRYSCQSTLLKMIEHLQKKVTG